MAGEALCSIDLGEHHGSPSEVRRRHQQRGEHDGMHPAGRHDPRHLGAEAFLRRG